MPNTELDNARTECRKHAFGTPEYDAAFAAVQAITRRLTDAEVGKHVYNSIEGDVFAPPQTGRRSW
jgi:hypothetical protein